MAVEDDVDGLAIWHGIDGVEKADGPPMPVALRVPADEGTVEHLGSGRVVVSCRM